MKRFIISKKQSFKNTKNALLKLDLAKRIILSEWQLELMSSILSTTYQVNFYK